MGYRQVRLTSDRLLQRRNCFNVLPVIEVSHSERFVRLREIRFKAHGLFQRFDRGTQLVDADIHLAKAVMRFSQLGSKSNRVFESLQSFAVMVASFPTRGTHPMSKAQMIMSFGPIGPKATRLYELLNCLLVFL